MRRLLIVAMALGLFLPGAPRAGEGRVPIFGQTTITQPGHYVVTRDITLAAGEVVRIQSDNVTLDLNGRTLESACGSGVRAVITTDVATVLKGLVIRNGRIRSGCNGISADGAGGILIEAIDIEPYGAQEGGIVLTNFAQAEVIDTLVHDSPAAGIVIQSLNPFSGRVVGNTVRNVGGQGLVLTGLRGGEVRGNVVQGFGSGGTNQAGITLNASALGIPGGANRIDGNRVTASTTAVGAVGMRINSSHGNLVTGNVLFGTTGLGIDVTADGNRLEQNVTRGNGHSGILVAGSYNHLEANQSQDNAAFGLLLFGSHNSYRNNVLTGATLLDGGTDNVNAGGNIF